MTEPKKGEPAAEPVKDNSTTPAPQDDGLPEGHKFKGKAAKEIADAYSELEKKQGQSAQEYEKQKTELDAYKAWYSNAQQAQQQSQAQAQTPDDDLYKAERDVAKEEATKAMNQVRFDSAVRMAPLAMNEAKRQAPHLFEGDSEKAIKDMFMGTIMRGGMNPEFATDPNNWVMAAYNYHGQKTGYKPAPATQTMNPTQTELPNATKTPVTDDLPEVHFSATGESMFRHLGKGMKREDLIKEVQEDRAEEARRAK